MISDIRSHFLSTYWATHQPCSIAIRWDRADSLLFANLPTQLTWQQFHQLISELALWLEPKLADKQLIAYCGQNRLAALLCYCTAIALGKYILILNPALTNTQKQNIVTQNQIKQLLTDDDFAKFTAILTAHSSFKTTLPKLDYQVAATFTLTSGSSGSPKAVVHSIQNHLDNAKGVCQLMAFTAQNSWLLSLPLYHVSGQGIVWRWLLQGATLQITESKTAFWQQLATVSHASLVPTQLQRYLHYISSVDRPPQDFAQQHILLGGMCIPATLIRQAQQYGIQIYIGYGMTEMASTITATSANKQEITETDNVGKALQGRKIQIVEEEIWVKGAGLALGYWQNGQIISLTNRQGWLQTKDKGYWDNAKNLVITGRKDNLFISGGENIQPEMVEKVLFSSNLLKNVWILPIPDPEFGARPIAIVEFHTEFNAQAVNNLQNFAKSKLEKFKLPLYYLPFNSQDWQENGVKISRQQLTLYAEKWIEKTQRERDV
ncbi:2-succinylbenzoyl-CoA synthetase [Nicoletella semolina]|uniref:2-succinylbenzoyl-CoA synthetase n=1 Tax=Nicoletella semolina TaxID=271160 RepID=A0A4R2NAV9_9PAST|nr:o-succinylbenzoate--CoA ligase [Nicoletella semolina]MDH2924021.1 hypothetical protein [Nicoletella semolina]TCP18154.1 2-succinylbenzoyl-CoA synthetase [Nicoletella semolina]